MRIIRPAGLIFFSVLLIMIVLFNIFFLDTMVKKTFINSGEEIFKSVVDIKKVDVQLLRSRLEIHGVQIADKDNEFKNLFEAEKIVFDYEFIPLLMKKVIIDNIELSGFATGTKRGKSGKLPEKRIKEIEKKEEKTKKENKVFAGISAKIKDKANNEIKKLPVTRTIDKAINLKDKKIEDLIKKEDTQSYKTIIQSKSRIEESKQQIENKINILNIEKRSEEIKQKADSFKSIKVSGVSDIPAAQAKLKELDAIKNEINSIKKDVDSIKNEVDQFVKFTANIPDDIQNAKDNDIQIIMSKMDLDVLNAKDIETAIVGPIWKSRIDKLFQIISFVNKHIPEGKKTKKKGYYQVVRKKGTDFHFLADKPSFWIKNIKMSKSDKTDGIGISGKITDLCFEQNLINKPCIAELNGKKQNKTIGVSIKIDRISDINDVYLIKASGFSTEDAGLNSMDYGNVKFVNGSIDAYIKANMDEKKIKIEGNVDISRIKFDASDKQDILFTVLSSIESMKININAVAVEPDFSISITSDILNKLDAALKKVYGKKMQEARAEIEKQLNNLIKNENDKLNQLSKQSTMDLKNKVSDITKNTQSLDTYVDNIKKDIIKKIGDTQKGTTDGVLKGMFK